MPSDLINILECLVRAQHFQRIATNCVVFIEHEPFICSVDVTLISEHGEVTVYKFNRNNSFIKNAEELQRLEEKFYQLNGEEDD